MHFTMTNTVDGRPLVMEVANPVFRETLGVVSVQIGPSTLYLNESEARHLYESLGALLPGRGDATETITATFSTSGDYFRPAAADGDNSLDLDAAATMLEQAASSVRAGQTVGVLRDKNGNTVGEVNVR